jgi:hypothetical protein
MWAAVQLCTAMALWQLRWVGESGARGVGSGAGPTAAVQPRRDSAAFERCNTRCHRPSPLRSARGAAHRRYTKPGGRQGGGRGGLRAGAHGGPPQGPHAALERLTDVVVDGRQALRGSEVAVVVAVAWQGSRAEA